MSELINKLASEACIDIESNKSLRYEDAVLATLMEPHPDEHTVILEQAQWNGKAWEASLLYVDAKVPNVFIKKSIKNNCRSEDLAKILSQYTKSNLHINHCNNCNCGRRLKYNISNN